MKTIPLTQGKVALVDDDAFQFLNLFKWRYGGDDCPYATRSIRIANKIHAVLMHRVITLAPSNVRVDHRNGNTLDNQGGNLRYADHGQNMYNKKTPVNNTSGFKGVSKNTEAATWRASIQKNKKRITIGSYRSPELAAQAYDTMASKLFGEFARLNFPETS